jgi:hypothetical protein
MRTRIGALLLVAAAALAEPPRRAEVYGHAGWFSIAGDESTGPGTLSLGGGVLVPFSRRFALDGDVSTAKTSRDFAADSFRIRATYANVSVVARWGSDRTYFFAGGGAGLEHDRSVSRAANFLPGIRPPTGIEVAPGVFEFRHQATGPALIGRVGFVQAITQRLLMRVDLLWSQRFVAPSIGVRAGVGYRF